MMRLKGKNASPDAFMIPELGNKKNTPISYQMGISGGKMDTANAKLDLGRDPKSYRTEIRESRVPKSDIGLASDIILDPEELEPSRKKKGNHQTLDIEGGEEVQIRIGNSRRSKRKTIRLPNLNLQDTRDTHIEVKPLAPNLRKEKGKTVPVEIGDSRDLNNLEQPKLHSKKKDRVSSAKHSNPDERQEIDVNVSQGKQRKTPSVIPVMVSSGFHCDFNPMIKSHRNKIRKEIARVRNAHIEVEPEMTLEILSGFKLRQKKVSRQVGQSLSENSDPIETMVRPKSRDKHQIKAKIDVHHDEHADVDDVRRAKTKKSKSRVKFVSDSDTDGVELEDKRHTRRSKSKTKHRQQSDNDADQIDISGSNIAMSEKDRLDATLPPLGDGRLQDIDIKSRPSTKKGRSSRLKIDVPPSDGEVTISAKPSELGVKKGMASPISPGGVNDDNIDVENHHSEVKKVKNPDGMEVSLYPTDREGEEGTLEAPKSKIRGAKATMPMLEPGDDENQEIEKTKNVMIFT